jgi:RNA polymerase sigma factor for flagellar operon FliA
MMTLLKEAVSDAIDTHDVVVEYLWLVKRVAKHLVVRLGSDASFDDLAQDGLIGLMDAARKFDPSEDCTFESYATTRIRGAMFDGLRQLDRLSRSQRASVSTLEKTVARLTGQLGRIPSEGEIASAMGIPLAKAQSIVADAASSQVVYLEDFDDSDTFHEHSPDALEVVERERMRLYVHELIDELSERDRLVVLMHYIGDMGVAEIAEQLNVTPARICQIRTRAIRKMRKMYEDRHQGVL